METIKWMSVTYVYVQSGPGISLLLVKAMQKIYWKLYIVTFKAPIEFLILWCIFLSHYN